MNTSPATNAVLVLSIRGGGGVRPTAHILRAKSLHSVLVSSDATDRNRDACDDHIVVDWNADELSTLDSRLAARGIRPIAVVNNVEPLIGWQVAILEHYGLLLGDSGLRTLGSKTTVRETLRRLGLSDLRFWGFPAAKLDTAGVDHYPVILKPSQDSGASRFVRRADDEEHLRQCVAEFLTVLPGDTELIAEEYIAGTEHSLDGPVLDGRFQPLLHVEKTGHDERRHHDAGLCVSPPNDPLVGNAVPDVRRLIDAVCRELNLDRLWLHVEARTRLDGSTELVEINTRPGGRLYRAAVIRTAGIDPFEANLRLSLPDADISDIRAAHRNAELIGMVVFDADSTGTVRATTTRDEMLGIDGVVDALISDGLEITTLEQENTVAEALVVADSISALTAVEDRVRALVKYDIN